MPIFIKQKKLNNYITYLTYAVQVSGWDTIDIIHTCINTFYDVGIAYIIDLQIIDFNYNRGDLAIIMDGYLPKSFILNHIKIDGIKELRLAEWIYNKYSELQEDIYYNVFLTIYNSIRNIKNKINYKYLYKCFENIFPNDIIYEIYKIRYISKPIISSDIFKLPIFKLQYNKYEWQIVNNNEIEKDGWTNLYI